MGGFGTEFVSQKPDETALVLSGGGAQGAFSVGVVKALIAGRSPSTRYRPLEVSILTGTSVGAVNASLLAGQGATLDAAVNLESVWTEKVASAPGRCGNGIFRIRGDLQDYSDINCLRSPATALSRFARDSLSIGQFFVDRTANLLASSGSIESRAVDFVNIDDFIDSGPLHDLLREVLDPAAVVGSRQRLKIVATNWVTGSPLEFTNADFASERGFLALLASSAIPAVFRPVQVEADLCVDGGVVQNTPLKPAIEMGASELHVVYLSPDPGVIPLPAQPNTINTLLRMYFLMLGAKVEQDIETAQWINDGLGVIERHASTGQMGASEAVKLARVASQVLASGGNILRKLTVHRYVPRKISGAFGILDFRREKIIEMIRAGEDAALNHNCQESACILP
jgi:NTE family protein